MRCSNCQYMGRTIGGFFCMETGRLKNDTDTCDMTVDELKMAIERRKAMSYLLATEIEQLIEMEHLKMLIIAKEGTE